MNKRIVRDSINLMISNIIALMISILSSFVTPIILGHVGYGYFRIFTLYISYVPLLHMGFIDGILIKNAGKSIEEIDFNKFRTYSKFLFAFELLLSLVMIFISIIIDTDFIIHEIIIAISIYSFLLNMVTYFQFFSKCILNFDELSSITRLQSFINLFFLLLAVLLYYFHIVKVGIEYYLFYMDFVIFIILIIYIIKYWKIIFGESITLKKEKSNIFSLFKVGFSLMISYQVTLLMVNADNQFISMFFKISEYANYAFAYSLGSLLITVFGAISSVMLPYMKKAGNEKVLKNYEFNLSIIIAIIFFMLLAYYPIVFIVNHFIPSYNQSLQYLRIVFPGVAITCTIQSYLFNNFIMIKKMNVFCMISLLNLCGDFVIYYLVYLITKNTFVIALISIPLLLLWYLSLETYIKFKLNKNIKRNFMYISIMSFSFIIINHFFSLLFSIILYTALYISITYLIENPLFKKIKVVLKRS